MFGLQAHGKHLQKPTRFMTNSRYIPSVLEKSCDGSHEHGSVVGHGRSKLSQIYPPALCRTILKGIKRQIVADSEVLGCRNPVDNELCGLISETSNFQSQPGVASADVPQDHDSWPKSVGDDPPLCGQPVSSTPHSSLLPGVSRDLSHIEILACEEEQDRQCAADWQEWSAWDDVKGGELPAHSVHLARKRELEYLSERKVYTYASTSAAIRRTGRKPLRLKWIDSNKGDRGRYDIRSRLVCTEVRPKGVEAIFAATLRSRP